MDADSKIEFYEKVFDLLVSIGGAHESQRQDFVYHHARTKDSCDEYRFQGMLGHGGKYRSRKNTVDCYPEDETPARLEIVKRLNEALAKLPKFTVLNPDHGDLMTVQDWIESVRAGMFIDYDGYGHWATATHESDQAVKPSDLVAPGFAPPFWATHVFWFNR